MCGKLHHSVIGNHRGIRFLGEKETGSKISDLKKPAGNLGTEKYIWTIQSKYTLWVKLTVGVVWWTWSPV